MGGKEEPTQHLCGITRPHVNDRYGDNDDDRNRLTDRTTDQLTEQSKVKRMALRIHSYIQGAKLAWPSGYIRVEQ